ncbi:MAG: protein translocase subunit SecD [Candidatus Moraniibacteriota bacterium]|nr:MAG: protein translocase subunit SecD [Candidatus Moranbacteria bacterium]
MKLKRNLFLISLIFAISLVLAAPKNYPVNFTIFNHNISFNISSPNLKIGNWTRDLDLKLGLDLRGGTEVTLQADMSNIAEADRTDALDSVREVVARRVDMYGVAEATVKTITSGGSYRLSVAMPGIDNPDEALALIGSTAKLDFRELPKDATDSATYADFVSTDLTGSDLKRATVSFNPETGDPEVSLQFSEEGGKKFETLTEKNVGKPIGIFMDDLPLSAPIVQTKITGGTAVINGTFTLEEVKNIVLTLNAGALPVSVSVLKQQNIAPSLGEGSVKASLTAGGVGLFLVALFMILNYGSLGFVASLGLIFYGILTLALYKLIPITLTLPGLAGFILSIGMAVDSNILIFERMKEETRKGGSFASSMELGFGKAWDAIKDANTATLMATFILYNPFDWSFLNSSGMVRGFALTLFLGILVSLFTGLFVTRNLLRAFIKGKS